MLSGAGVVLACPGTPFVLASSHRVRIHSGVRGPSAVEEVSLRTRWAPKTSRGSRFAGGQDGREHTKGKRPSDTAQDTSGDLNTVPCALSQGKRDDSSFDIDCPGTARFRCWRERDTVPTGEHDATLLLRTTCMPCDASGGGSQQHPSRQCAGFTARGGSLPCSQKGLAPRCGRSTVPR